VFLVILYDATPALLEAVAERSTKGINSPQFVTCPNEMVALSCAQGYAQVTGKPAAVIVHVDCGTQALAGAVHNVDRCRTPVSGGIFPDGLVSTCYAYRFTADLQCHRFSAPFAIQVFIYAGAAPYTINGEVQGSRK
jgi:hypothetical protein